MPESIHFLGGCVPLLHKADVTFADSPLILAYNARLVPHLENGEIHAQFWAQPSMVLRDVCESRHEAAAGHSTVLLPAQRGLIQTVRNIQHLL